MLVLLPRMEGLMHSVLGRLPIPHGLRQKLLGLASQVLLGVRSFHQGGRIAGFAVLTVVIWSIDVIDAILLARALGLTLTPPVALLLIAGMGLGSALPSTPGYVGIYQFVAVTVLVPFGFSHTDALAYSLVMQAFGYVWITFWGLIGLWRYNR